MLIFFLISIQLPCYLIIYSLWDTWAWWKISKECHLFFKLLFSTDFHYLFKIYCTYSHNQPIKTICNQLLEYETVFVQWSQKRLRASYFTSRANSASTTEWPGWNIQWPKAESWWEGMNIEQITFVFMAMVSSPGLGWGGGGKQVLLIRSLIPSWYEWKPEKMQRKTCTVSVSQELMWNQSLKLGYYC